MFHHLHINDLKKNVCLFLYLNGDRALIIFVTSLVHLAAEPTPNFFVERVTVVVNSLPSLVLTVVVFALEICRILHIH